MYYFVYIYKVSELSDINQIVIWVLSFCVISYTVGFVEICFFLVLYTVIVCFIYDCRVAFFPILTLTATAWDPTIFRYL